MSQNVIRVLNENELSLSTLTDTNISTPTINQTIVYNGSYWENINLDHLSPLIQNVHVVSDTFYPEANGLYVVSVTKNGIICYLPSNPQVGDYIEIVDKFSPVGGVGSFYGFGNYNLNILPSPGFYIEDALSYKLEDNGAYLKLIYIGAQTWRVVKTGVSDSDDVGGTGLVTSVNDLIGDVKLSTNTIPETISRQYYNTQRFLTTASTANIDVFADVLYDQPLYDSNVLTWDGTKNKWVPRSNLLNLYINNLEDVVVEEYVNFDGLVSHGGNKNTTTVPKETVNSPIYTQEYEYIDEITGLKVYVPSVDTGLVLYRRDWVLTKQDNDLSWVVRNRSITDKRRLLADLQDVEISLSDAYPQASKINIQDRQVLQWDASIHRWKPGVVVDITTTDDIPEGQQNLYLSVSNLKALTKAKNQGNWQYSLGDIGQVSSALSNMKTQNYSNPKVLGWVPATAQWEAVDALTENSTTISIDESLIFDTLIFPNNTDPPWDKHPVNRGYFTGKRVQTTLQVWGELDWFKDVDYPYGRSHGQALVWSATENKWVAGYHVTAVTTDDLPQGTLNLYYDHELVIYTIDAKIDSFREAIDDTVNFFKDVNVVNPTIGQSLVWNPELNNDKGAWVNGFPTILPIEEEGELLLGAGDGNIYNFKTLKPGGQGQYLRVDYEVDGNLAWKNSDATILSELMFPDLPAQIFSIAKDLSDLVVYLGTEEGILEPIDFINPSTTGKISIYLESSGIPIHTLTDRNFYHTYSSANPANFNTNLAVGTIVNSNLIIALNTVNAYRPTQLVLQGQIQNKQLFYVSTSNDGIVWSRIKIAQESTTVDYQFEISEDMVQTEGRGINSEIIDQDPLLVDRNFYLITLPFFNQEFKTNVSFDSLFYRYIRLEPINPLFDGTLTLYEISIYGWFNNKKLYKYISGLDRDKILISGVPNLEIVLAGTAKQVADYNLTAGMSCWVLSSPSHDVKIYTNNVGKVFNNVGGDSPTVNQPIILPPNTLIQITYLGLVNNIFRWHAIVNGGGAGGSGSINSYYLQRSNHTGTQDVTTITGIADIAVSGSWNDLEDKPTFSSVTFSGSYTDLSNKPTLGTSSALDVGINSGNIVQVQTGGRLPALDGSLLTNLPTGGTGSFDSPLTVKGDLLVHNGTEEVRFPVGANGYVLKSDPSTSTGLRWDTVESLGTNAITLNGQPDTYYLDRNNHTGFVPVGAISGLATVATTNSYSSLSNRPILGTAAQYNTGTLASQVLVFTEDNKLPALDGSLLTNLGSPLTTLGDIIVRANGVDARLAKGTEGQILTVDATSPVGLKWNDPSDAFTNALTLNNQLPVYYLNRANHTGTQSASTITGLSPIATSGSYTDLINRPNFSTVAISGNYSDLSNRPTLGTASQFNVGTAPFNIVQVTNTGKIPAGLVDASDLSFQSPLTTLGDIFVYDGINDARLGVGTDLQLLLADSTAPLGLRWGDVSELSVSPELPLSFKGDLLVHNGTQLVPLAKGLDGSILSSDSSTSTGLKWINSISFADNITGADTAGSNKYYGTDNTGTVGFHTYTTGIGSPLTTKGDLYIHNGLTNTRLPLGVNNSILQVDISTPTGLKWVDYSLLPLNAASFNSQLPSYYLDRTNHTGTQPHTTITGLGSAATKSTGTLTNQVLLFTEDNKLPALDGSLLTNLPNASPLTTKGDLYVRSTTNTRLPIGVDGQILMVDSSTNIGLKWVEYNPSEADNALTLNNELPTYYLSRANHIGSQSHTTITGLGTAATKSTGTLANQVLLFTEDNKLPALDGSLLTNLPIPPTQPSGKLETLLVSSTTTLTVVNKLILINSSLTSFNITLPSTSILTEGDTLYFSDYAGNNPITPTGLGLNSINIYPNTGQTIQGYTELTLDEENSSVGLIYRNNRWTIFTASL